MNSKKNQPRLSVCMIVKNEEAFLADCLKSVAEAADEIVIVDTGSTDGTVEIARSFGARVLQEPWQENFSLHRNQSIAAAQGEWILQIDADEKLASTRKEIDDLMQQATGDIGAFEVLIVDRSREGAVRSVFRFPRLFRRDADPHYTGRVHNQLQVTGKRVPADLQIDHFGYDLPEEKMQQKALRSKQLLLRQLEDRPDDIFALFNLAFVEASLRNVHEVIRLGERVLQSPEVSAVVMYRSIFHLLFRAYVEAERIEQAFAILDKFKALVPAEHLDLLHMQAHAAYLQNVWEETLTFCDGYQKWQKIYSQNPSRCANENIVSLNYRHEVQLWRAVATSNLGKLTEAQACIDAVAEEPRFQEQQALELLSRLPSGDESFFHAVLKKMWQRFCSARFILTSLRKLNIDDLPQGLQEYIEENAGEALEDSDSYEHGLLLMKLEKFSEAVDVLQKFKDDQELGERAQFFAAQAYLETGEFERAIACLDELLQKYPLNHEARVLREAVAPPTEEVVHGIAQTDQEKEAVLIEAFQLCADLWQKNRPETVVLLLGEVSQILAPNTNVVFHELDDILRNLEQMEAHAIAHGYLTLAERISTLKTEVARDMKRVESQHS